MRLLVQRVLQAEVKIEDRLHGRIGQGLLVFLGIHHEDTHEEIKWCINKLTHLRIFGDEEGKMNLSIKDISGGLLVVSQFTLYGNCVRGRRPDFLDAAPPNIALTLYENFIQLLKKEIPDVQTGEFAADMKVSLINDGPVTFFIDTADRL